MANFDPIAEFEAKRPQYVAFCDELFALVPKLLNDVGIAHIERRTKELGSFGDKLTRLEKDILSLDEIGDLAGIRVIFYSPKDVDRAADIICSDFTVLEDELHGGTSLGVATFGYSSRHLIIRLGDRRCTLLEWQNFAGLCAEIQLRSVLQHAWAARSHKFDYKATQVLPETVRRKLFRLAALLEIADEQFDELEDESRKMQEAYAAKVKQGQEEAFDLELTAYSLDAYLSAFPALDGVTSEAIALGFDASEIEGKTGSIEDFVDYAQASGFKTLREVGAFIEAVPGRRDDLSALYQEARKLGFTPAALPFDVLVFLLAIDHGPAFGKLRESDYSEPIKTAVQRVRSSGRA